ncbi:MAG: YHS domain-containing protein [archaeon]|nr:YHS domain-containing protein [archaeon]MCP8314712.1 YHS domain-containing protein [archaeon]MCP8315594.1 YHS domain-containing protein [archaeon]MCP8319645.1 YHS domain-containing protein [archaeon]
MGVCPVCGMKIPPTTKYTSKYKDKAFFFCSTTCKAKFDENPEKYVSKEYKPEGLPSMK